MRQITFRLKPGQRLKEEIEELARERNISAGVLLAVVGNLEHAVLRMAGATPDNQAVQELPGPFEIVSGTGTISKEGCHIHLAVADKEGRVWGGHLKDGCVVRYTAEVVLGVFEDAVFRRRMDDTTGFKELVIE